MRVKLIFPRVEGEPEGRPERCQRCGGKGFMRYGVVERRVRDIRVERIRRQRWRCPPNGGWEDSERVSRGGGSALGGLAEQEDEGFERCSSCSWAFVWECVEGF